MSNTNYQLEVINNYNCTHREYITYGFEENADYILVSQKSLTNNPRNPYTNQTNYILTTENTFNIDKKGTQFY